jgi:hypothetical protein
MQGNESGLQRKQLFYHGARRLAKGVETPSPPARLTYVPVHLRNEPPLLQRKAPASASSAEPPQAPFPVSPKAHWRDVYRKTVSSVPSSSHTIATATASVASAAASSVSTGTDHKSTVNRDFTSSPSSEKKQHQPHANRSARSHQVVADNSPSQRPRSQPKAASLRHGGLSASTLEHLNHLLGQETGGNLK